MAHGGPDRLEIHIHVSCPPAPPSAEMRRVAGDRYSKCRYLRLFQGEIVRKILPGTCATAGEPLESFPRAVKRATRRHDVRQSKDAQVSGAIAEGGREMRTVPRSEERRVGKECRSRWSP